MSDPQPVELNAPSEQRAPADVRGQTVGTKEVFLAKARIFGNGDRICLELRAADDGESEMRHLYGAAETRGQLCRKRTAQPPAFERQRKKPAHGHDKSKREDDPQQESLAFHMDE